MADPSTTSTDKTSWLNDNSSYQRCFACGQQNPHGLQLRFRHEGERIITEFMGDERYQGFPGVIHGGILASLLDETMGHVTLLERRWVMTARLELRYRLPVPIGVPLSINAEGTDVRPRLVKVKGWITTAADPTTILCEADGVFLPLPDEMLNQAIGDWPGLREHF